MSNLNWQVFDRYFELPEVQYIASIEGNITIVTNERQYDDALMDRLIDIECSVLDDLGEYTLVHYLPEVFIEAQS